MDWPHLKAKIREIQDFPMPGVNFKDITPLLEDKNAFQEAIDGLVGFFRDEKVDKVVGIDARGFLLASAVAYLLGAGMVIVRKKGKLPYEKILREHDLEYGRGSLEMHTDSIKKGERILIVDDVLATGGTVEAAVKLTEELGGKIIGLGFLLEIPLGGREKLKNYNIKSLIKY
ncbi:adenine phosphoribosyltransferase [Candidatus Giovannonibacteria bacterium RIFCSPLOWO2_12_FULL_44_25]|uniref:Adenine phosphoribosyltransferase n=3 Tax=Parcubacteria group TaxID=1794811 RepID=A0A1F5W7C8_9BACT|nr:MAG: adenine phosphoribosyltransferase [Candidatus Giovannonibacteria bacterium GWA2_45_15]OGF59178.1 MAG: adenine phosphoribosyltransferase [Candidatus Giovannonibacteria bacterium RIFCSPHIGHO2_01_45_12]OGF60901.1 MAG: adenine phosphoribosyltransferase [Candidatus Giovannonibacteria bacterium RIFCSPHIGHO2_01_FULL_44_100]OGF71470.1 MAG: adenine phosphoribosyltransferase [Candidatus Giovannonibacteria bacterium RIFCSPHIGHO2_02_FULL_45_40]OGF83697.1 MAG: adenine phosphoribosyltransferase [Cand